MTVKYNKTKSLKVIIILAIICWLSFIFLLIFTSINDENIIEGKDTEIQIENTKNISSSGIIDEIILIEEEVDLEKEVFSIFDDENWESLLD